MNSTGGPCMPLTIVPCSKALGAEVRGLDLREPIDGGTAEALRTAWADHLILLVRGQQLRLRDYNIKPQQ